ncbi:MAG: tRNA (adenosine(37)-N6)-threonylcarbamoyltransferase complex transferase subunit TsaD [Bacteroidia bacterium]
MQNEVIILGIESSCDDTSAALFRNGKILANITAGQKIHELYGGVVPELASRNHQQNIVPVIDTTLKKAGIVPAQISAIAFTRGPGLIGSLLVGSSFAKSMALALNVPLIEVNHMQGHILAHFIEAGDGSSDLEKMNDPIHPKFPFLCLTVSGGHTQIVKAKDYLDHELLGQTTDDAVGEAFDKAAKILGLSYPGGPLIDKYARGGDLSRYKFPRTRMEGFNYSFSGIKTAFLNFINNSIQKDPDFVKKNMNDICASYQAHLISVLLEKLEEAADFHHIKEIAIAGGVSANSGLRKAIKELGDKKGWSVYIPPFEYCTDNAAMIAQAGYYKYLRGEFAGMNTSPSARM